MRRLEPYFPALRQYTADHAAASGHLEVLLNDVGYLAGRCAAPGRHPGRALHPGRRLGLLALAAAHLGLGDLHHRLVAADPLPVRVCWAHSLGVPHRELTGHPGWVHAVAVGRVGDHVVIVSGGADNTVRIWDAVSGRCDLVLDLLGASTTLSDQPSAHSLQLRPRARPCLTRQVHRCVS